MAMQITLTTVCSRYSAITVVGKSVEIIQEKKPLSLIPSSSTNMKEYKEQMTVRKK